MFRPDDPLAPPSPAFADPWRAEALALADAMTKAGLFSKTEWAEALGAALRRAEKAGSPDDEETYYLAVLEALEGLADATVASHAEQAERKAAWTRAYEATPHGRPVVLGAGEG